MELRSVKCGTMHDGVQTYNIPTAEVRKLVETCARTRVKLQRGSTSSEEPKLDSDRSRSLVPTLSPN